MNTKPISKTSINLKKAFDIFVAVTTLPLTLPVMAFAAVLVKVNSKGPLMFNQERLGMNKKSFTMHKFRTLPVGHKTKILENGIRDYDSDRKAAGRIGNFLRATHLDELPQIFNVLKGEMSLVGPRPHSEECAGINSKVAAEYNERFRVPVGMAGLQQIKDSHAYNAKDPEGIRSGIEMDNQYVNNFTPMQDAKILAEIFTKSAKSMQYVILPAKVFEKNKQAKALPNNVEETNVQINRVNEVSGKQGPQV